MYHYLFNIGIVVLRTAVFTHKLTHDPAVGTTTNKNSPGIKNRIPRQRKTRSPPYSPAWANRGVLYYSIARARTTIAPDGSDEILCSVIARAATKKHSSQSQESTNTKPKMNVVAAADHGIYTVQERHTNDKINATIKTTTTCLSFVLRSRNRRERQQLPINPSTNQID